MKRIYLCGPMSGIKDFNYPAFNAAAARLREIGHFVLSPVDAESENVLGEHQTWEWYMRRSLRQISHADAIALLPGWGGSKGAVLEYQVGAGLKFEIRTLKEWLP